MLDDPEAKIERWSQYILANSLDEARSKCDQIVEKAGYTARVVDVRNECIFEVETDALADGDK